MKTKELLNKIKSGVKEFNGIDVEGTIINENLEYIEFKNCYFSVDFSGTSFQNIEFIDCNLKSCDFKYTSIKKTEFSNCLVDGTDFSFSLINELKLSHVSCYDLMMTNENFHLLRSDESIGFHIDGIEHGWFSLRVCVQKSCTWMEASNYLGNDAPTKVLKTLIYLYQCNEEYCERWICFDDEPGAVIMKLVKKKDLINMIICDGKMDAYHIPKEELSLDKYMGDVRVNINTNLTKISREYIKAYHKIINQMGIKAYEEHWFKAPNEELNILKELMKGNLG